MGGSSGQNQQVSNAYAVGVANNVNVTGNNNNSGSVAGQKKSGNSKVNQDGKKMT